MAVLCTPRAVSKPKAGVLCTPVYPKPMVRYRGPKVGYRCWVQGVHRHAGTLHLGTSGVQGQVQRVPGLDLPCPACLYFVPLCTTTYHNVPLMLFRLSSLRAIHWVHQYIGVHRETPPLKHLLHVPHGVKTPLMFAVQLFPLGEAYLVAQGVGWDLNRVLGRGWGGCCRVSPAGCAASKATCHVPLA